MKEHYVQVRVKGLTGTYVFPPGEVRPPITLEGLARKYVERHAERYGFGPETGPLYGRIEADSYGGRQWFRFAAGGSFTWGAAPP